MAYQGDFLSTIELGPEEEAHILELGERYAPDSETDDLGNTESSAEWQPL